MNFLAHHMLAGPDPGCQLGSWLGDFVRGTRGVDDYPPPVRTGIRLHRALDTWVDRHPLTLAVKTQLGSIYRRYGGIILDVALDWQLAVHWPRWHAEELDRVEDRAYALLEKHWQILPAGLKRFVGYARPKKLLSNYGSAAVVQSVLAGIGRRLRHDNPLNDTASLLADMENRFTDYCLLIYPEAQGFAFGWLSENAMSTTTGSWSEERKTPAG